ncbi:DUF952 domain-containing protein [Kordiimonas aquimaris]|uniref:DUF952 domain-containing protein n=1 Tax=Kordiimonas aquimaris TaxID=707591 RepID=UPI0021D3C4E0|nr:DUF952 domain-containing protein [Kordiimonas aquimaris]
MENWIFKILRPAEWAAAKSSKTFAGAPIDVVDGYIHFSTIDQLQETANRHFADVEKVYILAFNTKTWRATDLKWEPSRGGDLFPHLYSTLDASLRDKVWELNKTQAGHLDINIIHEWTAEHA